jgi:2,3-bisphosphoglycerate-dependent phosphoglycerate mutase
MGTLIIIRHAESEWNLLGKWTGLTDVNLTDKGKADAVKIGEILQDIATPVAAYTSVLKRTQQTLEGVLEGSGMPTNVPKIAAAELNERDYGDLTGKNKWEVQAEIGDEAFTGIRRGWDYPVPGGETLKDVYARAVPYFEQTILPQLQAGATILLVAHGNTIRALMKHFDQVADDQVATLEMPFGQVALYTFEEDKDLPTAKEVRHADIEQTHA